MSPTAQQDGRTSTTLKIVSPPPADNSSSSGSSRAAGRKASSVNGTREERLPTILLISIAYLKWREKKGEEQNGESIELTSAQNELELLLARHGYTPDGPQTFFICADHDHVYTESENTHIKTAGKSDILDALVEAVSLGGSLVIYYSGHCSRRGRGKSMVKFKNGWWEYEEDGTKDAGPPYLISSHCRLVNGKVVSSESERIYGEEVGAALSKGLELNGGRKMTIILSFDTCHVATFFDHVFVLPYVYRAKALEGLKIEPTGKARFGQSQIIFLASTQLEEVAGTLAKGQPQKQYGAVTWLTTQFLIDPEVPNTVEGLVERLYSVCHKRQVPQIRALHPIDDHDLELLLS